MSRVFLWQVRYPVAPWVAVVILACQSPARPRPPAPALPLPSGLAGQKVAVYPLNTISADPRLAWARVIAADPDPRNRVDSILAASLTGRFRRVTWVLPPELRRAAKRAPGLIISPDQMATEMLPRYVQAAIGDPLRAQLRQLTAVATGGRYILVPTALAFGTGAGGTPEARLALVLCDIRGGVISWSTTLTGTGETPWQAVEVATQQLSGATL